MRADIAEVEVGLVVNAQAGNLLRAELFDELVHDLRLLEPVRVGNVDDVQQKDFTVLSAEEVEGRRQYGGFDIEVGDQNHHGSRPEFLRQFRQHRSRSCAAPDRR